MNTAHEGTDDMIDYLDANPCIKRRGGHRALPLDDAWPTRRAFVPQGCDQQGRLTPTIKPAEPFPVVLDRGPEDFDKPEPLTGKEAAKFWAVASAPAIAILGVVGYTIWVRFGHVF